MGPYGYGSPYHQQYSQSTSFQSPQFQHYSPAGSLPPPPAVPSPPPLKSDNNPKVTLKPRTPSPPPRDLPRHWDNALRAFFLSAGLTQTLKGFEDDILIMNADWEKKEIPRALEELNMDITRLLKPDDNLSEGKEPDQPFDKRKLDYMHAEKGAEPRTPGTINKAVSLLLARNRARNNASNRAEFLRSHKRRRLDDQVAADQTGENTDPSCARTDAKIVDRDIMMKFDVAKNEEGPLQRTMKTEENEGNLAKGENRVQNVDGEDTAQRHPGLDERIRSIETHLAVRYVPAPPVSLLRRLQFLEDHIIELEREYPPWAALHFNQPRRGWPPPPRTTPLIVPSHLTSTAPEASNSATDVSSLTTIEPQSKPGVEGKGKGRATKSSLHRAVLERLEVQKAIHDLNGEGSPDPGS
ncbi:hypothetical protein BV25DRAFT_1821108 [Artomyces pyxidatus]|uniref:Uncharacterized protein n=1 Tax=Artomyces pyxidatus TaxID=48021 RepID=A0ACB8TC85_9AGAM|nr:hypothetical protein BV25DRAFT_1821108 [Artomyces pyxidatus]